jgi:hypothetical protein
LRKIAENCGKIAEIAEIAENCGKLRKIAEIAENRGPQFFPPPLIILPFQVPFRPYLQNIWAVTASYIFNAETLASKLRSKAFSTSILGNSSTNNPCLSKVINGCNVYSCLD